VNAAEGADQRFLDQFADPAKATEWLSRWRERLSLEAEHDAGRASVMRAVNPAIIPRNHRIQEAIAAANYGDPSFFERLLKALERPYEELPDYADLMTPPTLDERITRTFCGT